MGFLKSEAPALLPGILLTLSSSVFQGFFYLQSSLAVANRPWSHICTTPTPWPAQERASGVCAPGSGIILRLLCLDYRKLSSEAEVGKALRRREGGGGRVSFPWVSRRSPRLSEREGRPPTNPEMFMGFLITYPWLCGC